MGLRPLTRAELSVDTTALARFLIGKLVVRYLPNERLPSERLSGRIVETEAYLVGDAACHAYRGLTPRNRSLFLIRGHAYVYRAYGTAWMLNVSGGDEGMGCGVLIRALEPLTGIGAIARNRGTGRARDLTRGPGRLAAALRIDRTLDGIDLCRAGPLWIGTDGIEAGPIGATVRIGITRDAERPLRFHLLSNPFVSGPRSLNNGLRALQMQ